MIKRRTFLFGAMPSFFGMNSVAQTLEAAPCKSVCNVNAANDLRTADPAEMPSHAVRTLGALAAGDGGGGLWRWDPASDDIDNTGTVLMPIDQRGTGRWVRQFDGDISAAWFGASPERTDNQLPLQAAIDCLAASHAGIDFRTTLPDRLAAIDCKSTNLTISGQVTLKPGVFLKDAVLSANNDMTHMLATEHYDDQFVKPSVNNHTDMVGCRGRLVLHANNHAMIGANNVILGICSDYQKWGHVDIIGASGAQQVDCNENVCGLELVCANHTFHNNAVLTAHIAADMLMVHRCWIGMRLLNCPDAVFNYLECQGCRSIGIMAASSWHCPFVHVYGSQTLAPKVTKAGVLGHGIHIPANVRFSPKSHMVYESDGNDWGIWGGSGTRLRGTWAFRMYKTRKGDLHLGDGALFAGNIKIDMHKEGKLGASQIGIECEGTGRFSLAHIEFSGMEGRGYTAGMKNAVFENCTISGTLSPRMYSTFGTTSRATEEPNMIVRRCLVNLVLAKQEFSVFDQHADTMIFEGRGNKCEINASDGTFFQLGKTGSAEETKDNIINLHGFAGFKCGKDDGNNVVGFYVTYDAVNNIDLTNLVGRGSYPRGGGDGTAARYEGQGVVEGDGDGVRLTWPMTPRMPGGKAEWARGFWAIVTPMTPDMQARKYWVSYSNRKMSLSFETPPPPGTGNVEFSYRLRCVPNP
ncbi:hypothetical protein [Thiohalocapsa halophila]|uniref:hypothetical protein n=1 Tax=Thiohalocapsa halophila TaxID=69359 RepID=UPI00190356AB|nr:hypothetical protein [Thiohalocapsa halophila]